MRAVHSHVESRPFLLETPYCQARTEVLAGNRRSFHQRVAWNERPHFPVGRPPRVARRRIFRRMGMSVELLEVILAGFLIGGVPLLIQMWSYSRLVQPDTGRGRTLGPTPGPTPGPARKAELAFSEAVRQLAWQRSGGQCECTGSCWHHPPGRCHVRPLPGLWATSYRPVWFGGDPESLDNCFVVCIPCQEHFRAVHFRCALSQVGDPVPATHSQDICQDEAANKARC